MSDADECPVCGAWVRGVDAAEMFEGALFRCDGGCLLEVEIVDDARARLVLAEQKPEEST